ELTALGVAPRVALTFEKCNTIGDVSADADEALGIDGSPAACFEVMHLAGRRDQPVLDTVIGTAGGAGPQRSHDVGAIVRMDVAGIGGERLAERATFEAVDALEVLGP